MDNRRLIDDIDQVMAQIENMQGNWDGLCSCTDCYWNMYHPIKREDSRECVSESLADTKMQPNAKECPSYWSYQEAIGKPKGGKWEWEG